MDVFLAKVEQLLPVLGQDFLKPVVKQTVPVKPSELLTCTIKQVKATGRPTENGFLVLKGSEAVIEERPSVKKYPYPSTVRLQLLSEGTLTKEADRLIFVKDYEFSSPSAAASAIHGGHANGLIAWKNDKGASLKELEQKEMTNNGVE